MPTEEQMRKVFMGDTNQGLGKDDMIHLMFTAFKLGVQKGIEWTELQLGDKQ